MLDSVNATNTAAMTARKSAKRRLIDLSSVFSATPEQATRAVRPEQFRVTIHPEQSKVSGRSGTRWRTLSRMI
jgi:hypothetical protein